MTTPARIVLGSLLAHPDWFTLVSSVFTKHSFEDKTDRALWTHLHALHSAGQDITPIDALATLASIEDSGSAAAEITGLMRLADRESKETFVRRCDALHVSAVQRLAHRGVQRLLVQASEGTEFDWADELDSAATQLRRLDKRPKHYAPITSERVLATASNRRRKIVIPTGFEGIDQRVGGFVVGWTIAICARTNVGKSSFIAALARNQFYAHAARSIDSIRERSPALNPYNLRQRPGHARHPKHAKIGERAPYVLILSVEDDVDDYLGRFICDIVDIPGNEFLLDPERAVGERREGAGYDLRCMAKTFGDGRLAIADYEADDSSDEKTYKAIESTILGWKQVTEAPFIERGEEPPPLLVLLDYFQKIELPDDETKTTQEYRLLKKISGKLHALAKRRHFALGMAVMLLRDRDDIEPDHNAARGGSDVIQDAEGVWSLWPFGPGERVAIEAARVADAQRTGPQIVDDEYTPGEHLSASDDLDTWETPDDSVKLPRQHADRALGELLVLGNKGRHVQAGWEVPLFFDRPFKRITAAYDDTIYRRDPQICAALVAYKKSKKDKR